MPSHLPADVQDLIQRMITVDPDARITLPEIKRHPWFRSNRRPGDSEDDDPLQLGGDAHFDPDDPVDPEVMETLETLGWGEHDQLLAALHSDEYNLEKVFYRLLERRQAEKEAVLAELYPEEAGGGGGSGGAGSDGSSAGSDGDSPGRNTGGSPVEGSRYMQRRSRGQTDGSDGPAAPPARTGSRSSPLNVDRSGGVAIPSSSRESPQSNSPRYEKRRLSATAEQIAAHQAQSGSTPVKKSWFATMFDAKRKSSTKVASSSSSTFGLHSAKTLEEILGELTRVFEALGIKWKLQGQFMIKAKYTNQQSQVVKFKIEIRDVESQGHFINFSLRQGDLQTYRTLYDILQNELDI
jgi:serine/threonine protein kinase